jgi:hypothetical protein
MTSDNSGKAIIKGKAVACNNNKIDVDVQLMAMVKGAEVDTWLSKY